MVIKVINLVKIPIISSRDIIHVIYKAIKKHKKVILDFEKIEFISRSAIDELLNLKSKINNIEFTNMNDEIVKVLRIVAASKAYPQREKFKPPKKTTLSALLSK